MWMLVMFDLPVNTPQAQREATRFRQFLLDRGFEMNQFSVYMRFCGGQKTFEAHVKAIEQNLPSGGDVQILQITDKQYERIRVYSGQTRRQARKNPNQLALF
ncbi:CRISPR-associated endonuclease Cas2 [Thermopetrobacter sp. TC1]|uniref:CRISPR-associated endonuclease Cas2 n=1 Tax=Thermopetrobacter sp. TC1 TaxID=1495045 RepID=UPI0009DDA7FF|nr:CRISPR-associated endonuclease Cas2 [Thermopetrobacter sp. TC1]